MQKTIAFILSLGFLATAAHASPVTGIWQGTYSYPAGSVQTPVKFQMVLVEDQGRVLGFVKEPNTFGKEGVPWLHAVVHGRFDPRTRQLTFTKKYDETGNVTHDVKYTAQLDNQGEQVNGRWSIRPDWGGAFSLNKAKSSRHGMYAGLWSGRYHYVGESGSPPVQFWMLLVHKGEGCGGLLKEPNTFAEGDDPWLHSVVSASAVRNRRLQFTKIYDGTGGIFHTVDYVGRLSQDGRKMSGRWDIVDDWGARFALQKVPSDKWQSLDLGERIEVEKIKNE